jgi:hypothetical protein
MTTKDASPWPNSLNPCPTPDVHSRKKAFYGVQGKVTELCVECATVAALIHRIDSFEPDPEGAAVIGD